MAQQSILEGCPTDRVSNLPRDVMDNILKHLPLRDAVRTSTLSRDWKYKWVTIPYLVFDDNFQDPLSRNYTVESVIDQILGVHNGAITKFLIMIFDIKSSISINQWLFFLLDHPIDDLSLSFFCSLALPEIPIHVFAFHRLTHLRIDRGEFKLPSTFIGFNSLVRLELVRSCIELGELKVLLSKCPVLEYLDLSDCNAFSCLYIDSPSLKYFTFVGTFSSIYFKNANIEKISITNCAGHKANLNNSELPNSHGSNSNLIEIFGQLPFVETVGMNSGFIQYLANGGVPKKLPNDLNHIVTLSLNFDLGFLNDVQCTLCLIRSSPNLRTLRVSPPFNVIYDGVNVDPVAQYLKGQQKCNVALSCLKFVGIYSISGSEHEMEFVKLLLLWATKLEKFEFSSVFYGKTEKEGGYKILRELASFHGASSNAELNLINL